jgi:hypothetical protein
MSGALVYALLGIGIAWWSLSTAIVLTAQFAGAGSSGLGAVSIGVSEALVETTLPLIACIVVSWMLGAWARTSSPSVKWLHRAQRWGILIAFVSPFVLPAALAMLSGSVGVLESTAFAGLVCAVEFLLTAALLGAYARRTARG